MTRYRLPDALGGGEYDCVPGGGERSKDGTLVAFDLPGLKHIVWLPAWILTEIKPPLPDEPPNLTVLQAGTAVYQRDGGGDVGAWWMAGRAHSTNWPSIAHLDFVRLVPDPFVEPVELPWEAHDDGVDATDVDVRHRRVEVVASFDGRRDVIVRVHVGGANGIALLPDTARTMARALWAAADKAEAQP